MFADFYLPDFDHEMATTRRVLARVSDAHADWRPHPRYTPVPFTTTAAMLDALDTNVRRSRAAIAGTTDEQLKLSWTLRNGAQVFFSLPRTAALRSYLLSHSIHHRGQLSVYLRLLDVAVPSIYGPTADEAR